MPAERPPLEPEAWGKRLAQGRVHLGDVVGGDGEDPVGPLDALVEKIRDSVSGPGTGLACTG
jgi:hypothetical protein